ncbi:hypothetical protein G7Y89_g9298 [Cudoniella acicularis]|uniref:chitinase n=1 Tax=Cudoniella acicularis TaxID=354080 RepID=A0A8H4VZS1_9HELO|nr:hypothetical protein G7Y89_g9298 [Cudoniella acicularis]
MKSLSTSILCLGFAVLHLASARYVMYIDQYHLTDLPNSNVAAGIDHVIIAFANSSLFATSPAGNYTPFEDTSTMRARFPNGTKMMVAIGGWGDTAGFSAGAVGEASRTSYAANIANMLDTLGFDGVDIDWEYPGGKGQGYRQIRNANKTSETGTFPLLLAAIKSAIGTKQLSIAVPGLERGMIAYTANQSQAIWQLVDFVNIMTYDLMNRRDNITKHHTSVEGSLATISHYLYVLSLPPQKANLGFEFYAKYFTTNPAYPCQTGLNCTTVLLENKDGSDTGKSGAIAFEKANYAAPPANLTESSNGTCRASVSRYYTPRNYYNSSRFYGSTSDYHGANCQSDHGFCNTTSASSLFLTAMANGTTDQVQGGQYYYNASSSLFWTWDTPDLIDQKFTKIVKARGLGGVMAWSAGEDSHDWSHILALQRGMASNMSAGC